MVIDGQKIDSPKVNALSTFRNLLGIELNQKNEVSIYTELIGNITSRPIGTPYVNTSYAYIHKDALFVTMDAFHDRMIFFYSFFLPALPMLTKSPLHVECYVKTTRSN